MEPRSRARWRARTTTGCTTSAGRSHAHVRRRDDLGPRHRPRRRRDAPRRRRAGLQGDLPARQRGHREAVARPVLRAALGRAREARTSRSVSTKRPARGRGRPATSSRPNFGLRRIFAQPVEQMLALGSFIAGGVLARHPKLRAAFLEANCSWVPWLVWRMDEMYELEGDLFMTGPQDEAERVLPPPVLRLGRARRSAGARDDRRVRQRSHRLLDRLPARRLALPERPPRASSSCR